MKKFWQLLQESIIVQSLITLLFAGATVYLFVVKSEVPDELLALTSVTLGFWFRSKNTHDLKLLARTK